MSLVNAPDNEQQLKTGFNCSVCHKWHDVLPTSYSLKVPLALKSIPETDLPSRVMFSPDECIIDRQNYYLRGRIPVPVIGEPWPFIFGVWAKVPEEDFTRNNQMWKVEGREAEPPYRGWLDTPIPFYPDTLNLAVLVRTQKVGMRPHFELVDTAHPLSVEQRNGISMDRVRQMAEEFFHP